MMVGGSRGGMGSLIWGLSGFYPLYLSENGGCSPPLGNRSSMSNIYFLVSGKDLIQCQKVLIQFSHFRHG